MSTVVVIGAGVGGLAAAARLAALGHRVQVHERAPTHGGKLGIFTRQGFTFDTGPSLLTLPHVLSELFNDTGGPADLELVPVDPACSYRFADGVRFDMPFDTAAVPAALDAALGSGAGVAWQALHERSARLWELVDEPVLRRPLGLVELIRMSSRLHDLRLVAPWRTLAGLGRMMLPDLRLRAWLGRYATYSGSDPRCTPSALSVTSYVEQRYGSWYVRGGLRRIADALLARCDQLGVEVHLGSEIAQVCHTRRGVTGVRLSDGRNVAADLVVCDADATVLHEHLLSPRAAARTRRILRRTPRSLAGFVLLLALDGRVPGPAHRVWFPANQDAEFDTIFGPRPAPVEDPTIYVHAPDDPALRPDDRSEGWFMLVNAPPHDPVGGWDWDAPGIRERYADHILAVLASRGDDVRDRIRWREIRTPADLERNTAAPGGAIYGTASHGARAALRRPANRSRVTGLYLVGGSAHPGGGLPLVLLSAKIVAILIGPARTDVARSATPRR